MVLGMGALLSREALDALVNPKFLDELPEELRDKVRFAVGQAGTGNYGTVKLGSLAPPVREAAKRLKAGGKAPARLARALQQIAQMPGY